MILTLIIAFFSLIALMVIHEFGHFIIAKKFGVRVDEFGIGYPPRIFGKKFGETIYSINWLPLGAFVRIYGEEGGVDDYRSFLGQAIWKRVLIVLGGVIAFWLAAIVIFSVVFLIGADLPVGDVDTTGLTNVRVQITSVSQNSPADLAGIKAGDIILSAGIPVPSCISIICPNDTPNSVKIDKVSDYQDFVKKHLSQKIYLTIKRGEEIKEAVSLTPRANPPAGQGSTGIGLQRVATLIHKSAWYMAPVSGTVYTWETTVNALKGLWQVVTNLFAGKGAPQGAEFAGPLGITVFLAQAANLGVGFFLYFIGSIAVFIAIFNLFPIPALDGGKFVFLMIEKVMRKPVPAKVEQIITAVFFFILISLSIFITIRFDIPRFYEYVKSSFIR